MCIAEHGGCHINRMNLCVLESADIGKRAVAHCAAHVENAGRLKFWIFLLQPRYRAISHVGVINAHLSHGVNVDGTVINRALCDIIVNIFRVVATGLAMYVDRSVVSGDLQVGIEAKTSNGWSLSSLRG